MFGVSAEEKKGVVHTNGLDEAHKKKRKEGRRKEEEEERGWLSFVRVLACFLSLFFLSHVYAFFSSWG